MTETEIKYFTPEEANRTLPLVRKIVKDILEYSFQLKTITDAIGEEVENNRKSQNLISEIKGFMNELELIGCHYKHFNYSVGLVDFPSIINEEEVYLCWKSDEESIIYYHRVDEGFRNRKEIPEIYLQQNQGFLPIQS